MEGKEGLFFVEFKYRKKVVAGLVFDVKKINKIIYWEAMFDKERTFNGRTRTVEAGSRTNFNIQDRHIDETKIQWIPDKSCKLIKDTYINVHGIVKMIKKSNIELGELETIKRFPPEILQEIKDELNEKKN